MRKLPIVILSLMCVVSVIMAMPLRSKACRAPVEEDLPTALQSFPPGGGDLFDEDSGRRLENADICMFDRTPEERPDHRSAEAMVDDLMKASRCEAMSKSAHVDSLGHRHVRKSQYHQGILVSGGELVVHYDENDRVYHITGKYAPDLSVAPIPTLGEEDALQIGLNDMSGKSDLRVSEKPSLVIFRKKLAFRYILSHDGQTPGRWQYYVDAHDGTVLRRFNALNYLSPLNKGVSRNLSGYRLEGEDGSLVKIVGFQNPRGIYFMYNHDEKWRLYDKRAGRWERQAKPDWGAKDRAAVSCAYNFGLVQSWVRDFLGRDSYDDLGGFAHSNIHVGRKYSNAYWDGENFNFGDGDGVETSPLTSLDIVAHEYGHALTQYTSNLDYIDESGALNESYSDIMACAIEWTHQPVSYEGSPGHSDWMVGEDSSLGGAAFRDLRDPKRYGQPSYYKGEHWHFGMDDNGGVHTNSGVQNFAFYLLAQGGNGSNEGHSYNISGLGTDAAARIAMRANMVYLTPTSGYHDSRQAWLNAARDLGYPTKTVAAVWTAVGVN